MTNIAFAVMLIGGVHSPLFGGVASILFAVLALYVAVFHSPRALVGQLAGACLVSALATVHALSVAGAETSFVIVAMVTTWCVAASTSLTWQFVLLYLTVEARNAAKDPLTGLLNWRGLRDAQVSLAMSAHGRDSALIAMVIDLDDFKVLNDMHGHRAGDQALKSVSERLTGATGAAGLVARIGGDEFVVFLLVAREDVESKARDVHSAVFTSKDRYPLKASSGATVLVSDELSAEQIPHREVLDAGHSHLRAGTEIDDQPLSATELVDVMIDHADKAMYRAKKRGGHQLTWSTTFRGSSDSSPAMIPRRRKRIRSTRHAK